MNVKPKTEPLPDPEVAVTTWLPASLVKVLRDVSTKTGISQKRLTADAIEYHLVDVMLDFGAKKKGMK